MHWLIKKDGPRSAKWNMKADYDRLNSLTPTSSPTLRFYEWEKASATYGYFIKPEEHFDISELQAQQLEIARRPSGGGIIFHLQDLAFSISVNSSHPFYLSNTLLIYQKINATILEALQIAHPGLSGKLIENNCEEQCRSFCMAHPTIYDIVIGNKKLGGAAIRKTKQGLLYQGSLCLGLPDEGLVRNVLKNGVSIFETMQRTSFCLTAGREVLERNLIRAVARFI